jgi:hypothetical protein
MEANVTPKRRSTFERTTWRYIAEDVGKRSKELSPQEVVKAHRPSAAEKIR